MYCVKLFIQDSFDVRLNGVVPIYPCEFGGTEMCWKIMDFIPRPALLSEFGAHEPAVLRVVEDVSTGCPLSAVTFLFFINRRLFMSICTVRMQQA